MKTNLVKLSHDTARQFLAGVPRVCAIDATVGNGGDTLFLAELASASGGRVFGFDVQAAALERARARLAERSLSAELFLAGHEKMEELLPPELAGKFKYSDDGNKIRLDTKKSKDAFLKLMNDSFLRSELTKQYYEASTKDNITQASN